MRKLQRAVSMALILALAFFNLPADVFAAEGEARTVSIFRLEGDSVTMTKGTEREFEAKEGYRLHDGYTLSTGADSFCYLQLDEETVLKMDQKSKISVSQASKTKLSISLLSGSALMDAADQASGDTLEIRAGNAALAVRGTKFVMEHQADFAVRITMLEGAGDVDGRALPAGYIMDVYDDSQDEDKHYEILQFNVDGQTSSFALAAVEAYAEELVQTGVIEPGIVAELPAMIETKQAEEAAAAESAPPPAEANTGAVEYLGKPAAADNLEDTSPPPRFGQL